jgi:flagellar biogenesis protein FliO
MDQMMLLQFLGAFSLVIGLIIILGLIVKRTPFIRAMQDRKSIHGSIELRDTLHLDPKHKYVVVAWNGEEHLVFISPQHVQLISSQTKKEAS